MLLTETQHLSKCFFSERRPGSSAKRFLRYSQSIVDLLDTVTDENGVGFVEELVALLFVTLQEECFDALVETEGVVFSQNAFLAANFSLLLRLTSKLGLAGTIAENDRLKKRYILLKPRSDRGLERVPVDVRVMSLVRRLCTSPLAHAPRGRPRGGLGDFEAGACDICEQLGDHDVLLDLADPGAFIYKE